MWDYAHTDTIATDYDAYFQGNRLFELDEAILRRHFTDRHHAPVADARAQLLVHGRLGIGTHRVVGMTGQ